MPTAPTVMNFFFTQYWVTAQGGLVKALPGIQAVAYTILAVTLLMGVYESFLQGGSLRQLAITFLKFGVAGALIINWNAFITDVIGVGTAFGTQFMSTTGDMMTQWVTDMGTTASTTSLSSLLSNGLSAVASGAVLMAVALLSAILFVVCMKILTLCFIFWGGVLYCMGPLLIALGPVGVVGDITKKYCRSLAEWAMWPALYAMFMMLMNAIQMGNVQDVLKSTSTLPPGMDPSTTSTILLAVVSLVYGVSILIIPFIAHYVIGGSFAGVAAGAAAAVKAGVALASGGAAAPAMTSGAGGALGVTAASGGGGGGITGGGGSVSVPSSGEGSTTSVPPPRTQSEAPPRSAAA
jgi:hypothetical protein